MVHLLPGWENFYIG